MYGNFGGQYSRSKIICAFVIIVAISTILLSLIPAIPKSYAHAFVIDSDPSPSQTLKSAPTKVQVHLSEPVDLKFSKITVMGPDGKQVDKKDIHYINGDQTALTVSLPPGIKDGVYTVSTKMLSQIDGHVTDNAFVFGVGEGAAVSNVGSSTQPSSSTTSSAYGELSLPEAVARFPTLVGQVIVVGAAFATLWLWKPTSKIDWLNSIFAATKNKIDRSLIKLVVLGSIILVVSDIGMIYVYAYSINSGIGDAIATKFGTVWAVRMFESFVLLAIAVLVYRKLKKKVNSAVPSKEEVLSIFALGLAILVTTTLIGHGSATGNTIPVIVDFIHNVAASVWIGGVVYLGFVVVPKIKQAPLDQYIKAAVLSIIIPRFSTIPVVILGIIIITGPFLLYILEDNLDLTLASLYGKELIAKLVLAGIMISIGAYNQIGIQRQALKSAIVGLTGVSSKSALLSSVKVISNNGFENYPIENKKRQELPASQKSGKSTYKNKKEGPSSLSYPSSSADSPNSYISKKNSPVSRLSRSTKAEAIIGILLLVAVALLVNTGLPASEFQSQLQQQEQQQIQAQAQTLPSTNTTTANQMFTSTKFLDNATRVNLSINPFTLGKNNFVISFLDQNKNPIDIKSVKMKLTQTEQGIGPIEIDTTRVSKGIFSANAAFGLPGKWQVQIEAFQNKANSLNLVAIYNLFVKPSLDQMKFNIKEFKIPDNNSQPLYPLYDNYRNVIWVGDTVINSGRIFEFKLNSNNFIEHKLNGTSIVTVMALDNNHQIWYADPLKKSLGHYDPNSGTNQLYKIPNGDFVVSGTAIDNSNHIWLTSITTNSILRFNPETKNFTTFHLPTPNTTALGITIDNGQTGQIWVTESTGKIANIDPTKNYKIVEYGPKGRNNTLQDPTDLLIDPVTGDIYISEHEGHAVSVFDPILKTFNKRFSSLNPNGLPFGMAMDKYENLWVAEHTINKIAVIDPRTGEHKEVDIPSSTPFVQWITSDSEGNIWLAEQRGNSLGVISSTLNPTPQSGSPSLLTTESSASKNSPSGSPSTGRNDFIPHYGFNYPDFVAPAVAGGIMVSAFFYIKSVSDLRESMKQITNSIKGKNMQN
jgi:copper transport protein